MILRLSGFSTVSKNGFRVSYSGGHLIFTVENMPSARAHGQVVVEYLAKKLKRGSILRLMWRENVILKLMLCHVFGFRFSEPYAKTQT